MTDVQQIGGRRGATLAAAAVFVTILVAGSLVRADPAAVELTPGPQDGIAYRLGKRSLFRITAVNRSAAPQQVQASTRLRGSSLAAQSRDLWLPPKSRRTAWHPLYLPDDLPGASRLVEAETVYAERAGEDQPWSESAPGSASASLLSLETDRVVTALLYDGQDDTIRQLVVDARRTQNLSDRLTLLRTDALPTMAEWLECYDQMVLATDQLANDPAGLVAIRHWLESGGRLWIMLDQTPAAWVAPLVGDDFGITSVDRVRVAGGIVKDVRDVPRKADGPRRRFSEPIDLARIIADDISVDFEIDGWPAALRQRVGRGSILYTTLGREAWSSGTAPAAKRPASAVGPLEILASDFFQPRSETQNLPAAETVAASMIGYKILGRGAVAAILGANGLAIVALGVLPAARRRRHGMAGVAVALALASSCVIVGLGDATRRAVNPTLSSVQLVHVIPERGEMHVRGVTDAYLPTAVAQGMSGADCALAGDGLLLSGRGALHWLDDRRWRLNKPLPTGLSLMRLSWREPLHEKRVVSATLAEEGIVGTLNGRLFAEAETAILAAPGALPLAVRIAADGHFQAGAVDRLEAGQFAAAGLLDERTTRRQRL
ncbi:MAG: hypothetical protein IT424_06815 [Pirellulales bacterium]|nr:hypothetical protein [Pirellulales bacterium]